MARQPATTSPPGLTVWQAQTAWFATTARLRAVPVPDLHAMAALNHGVSRAAVELLRLYSNRPDLLKRLEGVLERVRPIVRHDLQATTGWLSAWTTIP